MVRHKNRYIVVEVNPEEKRKEGSLPLNPSSLYNSIVQKVQQLHGDFGVAAIGAGFTAKYCNQKTRIAVIKVRHGPHRLVASALTCVTSIGSHKAMLSTLYTGATIKQCFKFIQNYQQKQFDKFSKQLKTDDEKQALRDALLNLEDVMEIN